MKNLTCRECGGGIMVTGHGIQQFWFSREKAGIEYFHLSKMDCLEGKTKKMIFQRKRLRKET